MKDNPTKVIISEYVDLSACFYELKQVTFVNSILQNIANKNRPNND
jgi:transcription termination factor NusB